MVQSHHLQDVKGYLPLTSSTASRHRWVVAHTVHHLFANQIFKEQKCDLPLPLGASTDGCVVGDEVWRNSCPVHSHNLTLWPSKKHAAASFQVLTRAFCKHDWEVYRFKISKQSYTTWIQFNPSAHQNHILPVTSWSKLLAHEEQQIQSFLPTF